MISLDFIAKCSFITIVFNMSQLMAENAPAHFPTSTRSGAEHRCSILDDPQLPRPQAHHCRDGW